MHEWILPKQPGEVLTVQPDLCPEQCPCLVLLLCQQPPRAWGMLWAQVCTQCLQFLAYPCPHRRQ